MFCQIISNKLKYNLQLVMETQLIRKKCPIPYDAIFKNDKRWSWDPVVLEVLFIIQIGREGGWGDGGNTF